MNKTLKLTGFVIKKRILLNKDLLLTFFSKEEGKLEILAKGVRKLTSRRSSYLQTGNYLKLNVYLSKDRYYLRETSLISAFSALKTNMNKIRKMYFVLFVIDKFLPENQKDVKSFDWLIFVLTKISQKEVSYEKILGWIKKLVFNLGFSKNKDISDNELSEIFNRYLHVKLSKLMI